MKPALTKGQQEFVDRVIAGESVFLTGKAGTGKSYIVKEVFEMLNAYGRRYIAVAPTGVAANNIDGQTIHSLFQIPPFGIQDYSTVNLVRKEKRRLLKLADIIFIDEVSMLRPDLLDAIHYTFKKNGLKGLDERQVVFIGDLKQLPPILSDNERSVLYQTYDGDTFLDSHIVKKMNVSTVNLDTVVRQSDPEFIGALNDIREGGKNQYFRQFKHHEPLGIILAPHNSTVLKYNNAGLNAQAGQTYKFKGSVEGNAKFKDFSMEEEVVVKNGCKIMYLVNSPDKDCPLRNGTLGIFVSHAGCHYIRVNNTDFALAPVTMHKKEYVYNQEKDKIELKELGSITQYPIKLAYALTIHKAQGLTFDEVTLDLTMPCFQPGQMYVALSRVRTPQGLRIITR